MLNIIPVVDKKKSTSIWPLFPRIPAKENDPRIGVISCLKPYQSKKRAKKIFY
jgi:hypothetical protein